MASTTSLSRPAPARTSASRAATWVGLIWSLFGLVMIREPIRYFSSGSPDAFTSKLREGIMLCSAAALLVLIAKWERLPLRSVGLGTSRWWKSLAWGLVTAVLCLAAALVLVKITHYDGGTAGKAFAQLPLWIVFVTVLRAGFVEELFYRGFAIERLRALGVGRWIAALLPLTVFAVEHWTGGAANILIAFVLGGILTLFYLWRRDLTSNVIAHFLVDFVGNVLPRLLGAV